MKLNRKQFCALFKAEFFVVSVMFDELPHYAKSMSTQARKAYSYKAPLDTEVEVGDYVYVPDVDSLSVDKPNLKRAKVTAIVKDTDEFEGSGVSFKWIVGTEAVVLAKYQESINKDTNVRRAVQKLERAMERVELQAQMKLALELLSPDERKELTESLGLDLSKINLALPSQST